MSKPYLVSGQGSPQSVFESSSIQRHPVGAKGVTEDGRVFFYARYTTAATVSRGKLLASAVYQSNHEDLATGASSLLASDNRATAITIGATALDEDEYQYLAVVDGGGEGTMYRIQGHAAFDSAASTVSVTLAESIGEGSDGDTQVSLIKSPYADCLTATSSTDTNDVYAGITMASIASSTQAAPSFVWLQTWGPSVAWVDLPDVNISSPIPGAIVVPSRETDGNVMMTEAQSKPLIGFLMSASGTDAEVMPVDLRIRP